MWWWSDVVMKSVMILPEILNSSNPPSTKPHEYSRIFFCENHITPTTCSHVVLLTCSLLSLGVPAPLRSAVGLSAISFSAALQKDAAPIPNALGAMSIEPRAMSLVCWSEFTSRRVAEIRRELLCEKLSTPETVPKERQFPGRRRSVKHGVPALFIPAWELSSLTGLFFRILEL